jgi:hypothetical protein
MAQLTKHVISVPINSVEELVNQNEIEFAVEDGSLVMQMSSTGARGAVMK